MLGKQLNKRYRLDAEIGRGGAGAVYRAHDLLLGRDVAVKVLSGARLSPESRARLLREAQAAAGLSHRNIVTVYDAGEAEGVPYVVTELVQGPSLHDQPPANPEEMLLIGIQVSAALEHAHAEGVVHRDLKPENILMTPSGTAKLADFGLAQTVASRLTMEGTVLGTAFYLAPEQALGHKVDGRADLYALGIMLYEFATGQLPFTGDDALAVITQHLYAPVVPPRARNAAIPADLEALILRLLAKTPKERPSSATEVLAALREMRGGSAAAQISPPGEFTLLDRIVRGRMVGRDRELAQAQALWRRALAGASQVLLISGEPGIGKTRLVRELATRVQISGGTVLLGECYAEASPPYAPIGDILHQYLENGGPQPLALANNVLSDLLTLAPGLAPQFGDISPNPPLDPSSEQQRLFESVATFLRSMASRAPVLLILEDLHWAETTTLSLLRHLLRRIRHEHVLVVLTYREVELDTSRPLHGLLLEMDRERLSTRLKLSRLGSEGTRSLLATLFDEEITLEFATGIHRETEGNPFFIEELCKALVESGQLYFEDGEWHRPGMDQLGIPQSVQLVIEARLTKLPPGTQEVLRLAAIVGREFQFETLAAAASLDEGTLIEFLEAAERAQLVEEVARRSDGTFRFAHALIPPALTEGLSGIRRRRMHHQLLDVLQRLRPGDLEALAHHALEAGDLQTGIELSVRAARKAMRVYASDEALRHYANALEAAEHLDLQAQVLELHEAMGDIHLAQHTVQAADAFLAALALTTDPKAQASLKVKIGTAFMWAGDGRARDYLEEGIAHLDPRSQSNEMAQAIAVVGRSHHYEGQHRRAIEHFERALEIAEPEDDARTLTLIYIYLSGAHQHLLEFGPSMEWAHKLIEMGERKGHLDAVRLGYEYRAENFAAMGHWADTLESAAEDQRLGEEMGFLGGSGWAYWCFAHAYYGLGLLPAAQDAARQSLEAAELTGDQRLAVLAGAQLAIIERDRGLVEEAEQHARQAVERGEEVSHMYLLCVGRDALAHCELQRGDASAAFELLDPCTPLPAGTDSRKVPLGAGPRCAEAALSAGRPEAAIEVIKETLVLAREASSGFFEAWLRHLHARALAMQGDWAQAEQEYEQAIRQLDAQDSRLELGRALLSYGTAQADRSQGEESRASLTRALRIFEACDAQHWVGQALEALRALDAGARASAESTP